MSLLPIFHFLCLGRIINRNEAHVNLNLSLSGKPSNPFTKEGDES